MIDFQRINSAALAQFHNLLATWLPGGRVEGHEYVCADLTGGPGRSLSVNLQSGIWKDFATDIGGKDPVSLYAAIHGLKQGEAARQLAEILRVDAGNGNGSSRAKARITATYDYHDAAGNLLFQVVRLEPKSFRQRRPDGKGGWLWNMKGIELVPYHLPDLLEASEVYVVEGEKDADRLMSLGLVATCNAQGAGKWRDGYAQHFTGKAVFILPDNDAAGHQHAQQVAKSLQGVAKEIRVLDLPGLPDKGDVSDWLDSGGTVEQLQTLSKTAPEWTPDPEQDNKPEAAPMEERTPLVLADWRVNKAFPGRPGTRVWLCDMVFALGLPYLFAAMGGVGKSFSLLSLCVDVARGECKNLFAPMHFGGRLLAEGTAVYVSGEDDGITLHERIEALCGEARPERLIAVPCPDAGGAPLFFRLDERRTAIATEEWWDFRRQVMEIKDLVLVCIDPLQIVSALDLNLPENAQLVCRHISELASKTKAAVILSHHFRKTGSGKDVNSPEAARDAIRGSAGLVDGVRLTYAMWTPQDAANIAKQLGVKFVRGDVVQGACVKGNGKYNKGVQTYHRATSGLLVDMSHQLVGADNTALRDTILSTVAAAAVAGRPFTKTGRTGVHERRYEFAPGVQALPKHRTASLIDELLERGDLIQALAQGSTTVKWLDVPGGPFAMGEGVFEAGHGAKKNVSTS
jgi:hypothetical protein